jgi:hypothetical protein
MPGVYQIRERRYFFVRATVVRLQVRHVMWGVITGTGLSYCSLLFSIGTFHANSFLCHPVDCTKAIRFCTYMTNAVYLVYTINIPVILHTMSYDRYVSYVRYTSDIVIYVYTRYILGILSVYTSRVNISRVSRYGLLGLSNKVTVKKDFLSMKSKCLV